MLVLRLSHLGTEGISNVALSPAVMSPTAMAVSREQSFIMIKPDGVHRALVGRIIERFEARGYKLVGIKV